MKRVVLPPAQWVYTERLDGLDADEIIAQIRKDRATPGYREHAVYVVPIDANSTIFALYNGNHRALLAEWENRALMVRVLEGVADYIQAEADQPTYWADDAAPADSSTPEQRYSAALKAVRRSAAAHVHRRQARRDGSKV